MGSLNNTIQEEIAGREAWLEDRSRSSTQGHESRAGSIGFPAPACCSCSCLQATLPDLQFCASSLMVRTERKGGGTDT